MHGGGLRRGTLLGALLLAVCPGSLALAGSFVEQRYDTRDGLPSELVKSVARDRFGFVWLATDAGPVRFDGTRFTTYEEDVSFPFGKELVLTRDERLLAIGDAGLVEIAGTPGRVRFEVIVEAAPEPGPRMLHAPKGLYEDRQGRLWVSEPGALVRVDGGQLVRYELPESSHSGSFLRSYTLAEDHHGTLWVGAQSGELLRRDEASDRFVPAEVRWPVTVLNQLRGFGSDRLWAATARGLFELRVTAEGEIGQVVRLDDATQLSCVGRAGDEVFLGAFDLDSWVGRLESGRFVRRRQVRAFIVQQVFEDRDESLWLSTDEGLVRLGRVPFETVRLVNPELAPRLVSFVQTDDGTLYASDRGNVYRLRPGPRGMAAEPLLDRPKGFLLGLRTDGEHVWATTENATLELQGRRLVHRIDLEGFYALDLEKDQDEHLWVLLFGGSPGVLRVAPDGSRRTYPLDVRPTAQALGLDRSPEGEIFVVTNDPAALLFRWDPGRDTFTRVEGPLPLEPGEDFNVYDLAAPGGERFWVASSEGLLEVGPDGTRRVPVGPTADSPAAFAVTVDESGRVWFATSLGVIRLDPETGAHDLFDEEAGLPSRLVGVRDLFPIPGGGVTAVTARGTARLVGSPGERSPLPPPVLLEVSVGDRPVAFDAAEILVSYGGYLDARFASPPLGRRLGYQMRLEGRDASWRPPRGRPEWVLAGLDGGAYTLEVRSVLPGSDRASAPTRLAFSVARPWYRAWWALLLAGAALVGVAWSGHAYRSWRSLQRERDLEALVDERTRELSEANRLLGERNVEMERFIYTVSHDLKSPLISISGFVGLLEKDLERGELSGAQDSVERVKASASRMATLLDELLEMSRVGRVKDTPTLVETRPLAEEVAEEMAARFAERGVEVRVQPDMPTVYADRTRLRQVVQNLLDNALKFMGDETTPRLEIGGHGEDGHARLFVRDNGIGIDPAHHEAAFELFRRLSTRSDGTGVGLSLVKRIVEVHGGRVWIESEGKPGLGTTVWVELPTRSSD